IGAIEANQGLFNYRPVRPIDTIIARTILETIIYVGVYIVLMTTVGLVGEQFSLSHIITLTITWILLVVFSFGIGLIFMVVGNTFPEAEKFLPIIIKPLYFVSCVMFPLHAIPENYWPYFLWNPIVHAIELSRESVVSSYTSGDVSLGYLALSAMIALFIGLIVYRKAEEAMLTS
ncbi:TPA: ABC transporter permease, partial [Enterobacter roggenkampii]|nr:ABC transporter permease [Enterobacter roggenkampii]